VTKKKRIWIHPLAVKTRPPSEPLGLQERAGEIGQEKHGEQEADDVFQAHVASFQTRSQART
jgi:hypothetical protein